MDPVPAVLPGVYDLRLVVVSVVIAILAAGAALDLAGRVTLARHLARSWSLVGGAVAMGIGIWSMHYIGMLAFHLPIPVWYDWPTVLLSLFAAIAASWVALFVVSRPTMTAVQAMLGSLSMGGGIAAMHYSGMAAMRLPAMCEYSASGVWLSIVLAVIIAFAALQMAFVFRGASGWSGYRVGTAVTLGGAIPVMHYVGMAAVTFVPGSHPPAVLKGQRVIVVDDNATNRKVLMGQLLLCGVDPVSAGTAHEALMLMRQAATAGRPFDAALLDHQMPNMRAEAANNAAALFEAAAGSHDIKRASALAEKLEDEMQRTIAYLQFKLA